jgi:hypothetical protein
MRVEIKTGKPIKDNDLKALYLLQKAMEISSDRMRKANIEFIISKWNLNELKTKAIMTTEEGNKLIAEFMGATPCIVRIKSIGDEQGYECDEYKLPISELEYHSSWDWLMPVVEKIVNEVDNEMGWWEAYSEKPFGHQVEIWGRDVLEPIIRVHSKTSLLEATWQAVVQFIQWYNQSKNL